MRIFNAISSHPAQFQQFPRIISPINHCTRFALLPLSLSIFLPLSSPIPHDRKMILLSSLRTFSNGSETARECAEWRERPTHAHIIWFLFALALIICVDREHFPFHLTDAASWVWDWVMTSRSVYLIKIPAIWVIRLAKSCHWYDDSTIRILWIDSSAHFATQLQWVPCYASCPVMGKRLWDFPNETERK